MIITHHLALATEESPFCECTIVITAELQWDDSNDRQQACTVVCLNVRTRWQGKSVSRMMNDPLGVSKMTVEKGVCSMDSRKILFRANIFFQVFMLPSFY